MSTTTTTTSSTRRWTLRQATLSNASLPSIPTFPSSPPSPTFTSTTNASQVDLGSAAPSTVVTRRDLRESVSTFEALIADARAYREALSAVSAACARFANTIERSSRLKGVEDESAAGLQVSAGWHFLCSNQWEVLQSSIRSSFEAPLTIDLHAYRSIISERTADYERAVLEKSRSIKKVEAENMNPTWRKKRDMQSFRQSLAFMQAQVDELDRLKVAHYQEILEHENETWHGVLDKVALVVRSSLDVFDRLSSKSSDPTLEPLLQAIPDPFHCYGPPTTEGQLFSILTPLSIGPSAASTMTSTISAPAQSRNNSLSFLPTGAHSWMGGLGLSHAATSSSPEWSDNSVSHSPPGSPTSIRSGYSRKHTFSASSPPSSSSPVYPTTPPTLRRGAENKLRSVLGAMEEAQSVYNVNGVIKSSTTGDKDHQHRTASRADEYQSQQPSVPPTPRNFLTTSNGHTDEKESRIGEERSKTPTPTTAQKTDPEPRFLN